MKRAFYLTVFISTTLLMISGCDSIFGSKQNDTTDEIFEVGRIDPNQEKAEGYVALVPFWGDFDQPTDVFVGYDEFVYVTDAQGVHILDRADLSERRTIELNGAVAVTQDRLFNVYVAARYDTVITAIDPNVTWNLPAVFKIYNMNGANGPNPVFVDTLIHPFDDASRSSTTAKRARLIKGDPNNDELVEITGVATLADNSVYITRRGPLNNTTSVAAPDNIVLEFAPVIQNGVATGKMRNVRQLRALHPTNPSLMSSIGATDITSFINPPQDDVFPNNRSFLIAQGDQNKDITFRVLQVNAVETTDGLVYQPHTAFLQRDTSRADGFIYEENKFTNPSGIAVAGRGNHTGFIFVVDKENHRLYQFQSNGREGILPRGTGQVKNETVSFGSFGSGPRQFNSPSGVAYYRDIVYVADTGNNRITRYTLSRDLIEN